MKIQRIRVRFDGACSDNGTAKARATYGWKVWNRDDGCAVAQGHGVCTGELHTNNVAEYSGLIGALQWVMTLIHKPDHILIEGDSQLVIKTLTGDFRCRKTHLKELRNLARSALKQIGSEWEAQWIPRIHNSACDELSKEV